MTRARKTLTLARLRGSHPLLDNLEGIPSVLHRDGPAELPPAPREMFRQYRRLSLRDVFLSYAGYRDAAHPVHQAITALIPGEPLEVRHGANRWELMDRNRVMVGQLAGGFEIPAGMSCTSGTVLAIATWDREGSEPEFRDRLRCNSWEVVVPELVFNPKACDPMGFS